MSACLIWSVGVTAGGYGRITVRGERHYAHRWFYEQTRGPIPEGLVIDHLCRNTRCVNPAHLEVVTQGENMRRGMAPNMITHREDVCRRGHSDWKSNGKGKRTCRVCANARKRAASSR